MQNDQPIHKKWAHMLNSKFRPPRCPETHPMPKNALKGLGRAKFGTMAFLLVQIKDHSQKKPELNRTFPASVPFTRNDPVGVKFN